MECEYAPWLAQCWSERQDVLCQPCTLVELGESMQDVRARTANGIPKGKYYRDQVAKVEAEMIARRGLARGSSRFE